MRYLLLRLLINGIALYIATRIVPGLTFDGQWTTKEQGEAIQSNRRWLHPGRQQAGRLNEWSSIKP